MLPGGSRVRHTTLTTTYCGTTTTTTGSGTTTAGAFGYQGSTVQVCVTTWIFTLGSSTQTVKPTGCTSVGKVTLLLPCTGVTTPLTVSYTLRLSSAVPLVTWYGPVPGMTTFNPGPYTATTQPERNACTVHANTPPSPITWSSVTGPKDWQANGYPVSVIFHASSTGGFGYEPQFLGFTSMTITNYPANTYHLNPRSETPTTHALTTTPMTPALRVRLYQASITARDPGSPGPYHVVATGKYKVTWGKEYQHFEVYDICSPKVKVNTVNRTLGSQHTHYTWTAKLHKWVPGYTYWVPRPVSRVFTWTTVSCSSGTVETGTTRTFSSRITTVSGSWTIVAFSAHLTYPY